MGSPDQKKGNLKKKLVHEMTGGASRSTRASN